MERIANHQSVQMKDRLMTRDIALFFWASSKGGVIGQKVCVTNPNKLENL